MKKEDETVFYQGKVIGHIETDSDGDLLGIVYDPKSVRPWEIYGFNDIDQLKKEMLNQYNLRVLQGTESMSEISQDTLPTESSKWLQLIEGARVEGDTVILFVKDGNDGARFVCHELLNEKDLAAPVQEPVPEGCVVVARAVLNKLGINDDVIGAIARPAPPAAPVQGPDLAKAYREELDKLSQRNYELRMENSELKAAPPAALLQPMMVDCIGLALDLESQAKRVESQTVERAMLAAANGLRIIASHVI